MSVWFEEQFLAAYYGGFILADDMLLLFYRVFPLCGKADGCALGSSGERRRRGAASVIPPSSGLLVSGILRDKPSELGRLG